MQVQTERVWKTLMVFFALAAAALLTAFATLAGAGNEKHVLWGICLGLCVICLCAAAGSFVAWRRIPPSSASSVSQEV